MYKTNNQTLYIKTSNPSLFKGMKRNTTNWKLINESNDIEKIKKTNAHYKLLKEQGKAFHTGIKYFKESVTKSYKYTGEQHNEDISILKFKSEVYRDVAQNQLSIFDT